MALARSLLANLSSFPALNQSAYFSVMTANKYLQQKGADDSLPQRLTKENVHSVMGKFDTILTDCDGVFWTCNQMKTFPRVDEVIHRLRSIGNKMLFVSNNSLLDREGYIEKFRTATNVTVNLDEMYVVNYATAVHVKHILGVKKCYMIGTEGLKNELQSIGVEVIGFGPDLDKPSYKPNDILNMELENDVEAVVVGYDEHFHHNKMIKAASYLQDENCHFVATNDKEMRVSLGSHVQPVTGTFVAAISAVSGRNPTVVGKPNINMMNSILKDHPDIDPARTIMIGDSLLTDVLFAKALNMYSLLVFSGASSLDDVLLLKEKKSVNLLPNYYLNNICDLLDIM